MNRYVTIVFAAIVKSPDGLPPPKAKMTKFSRVQTVYDFSEKAGLVPDLVEKIWLGNDLVYNLTEIDILLV
jgi:hypothetical protein